MAAAGERSHCLSPRADECFGGEASSSSAASLQSSISSTSHLIVPLQTPGAEILLLMLEISYRGKSGLLRTTVISDITQLGLGLSHTLPDKPLVPFHSIYLSVCLSNDLPTYLPTYLPTHLISSVLSHFLNTLFLVCICVTGTCRSPTSCGAPTGCLTRSQRRPWTASSLPPAVCRCGHVTSTQSWLENGPGGFFFGIKFIFAKCE